MPHPKRSLIADERALANNYGNLLGGAWNKISDIRIAFDDRWTPEPNTGCWLWTQTLDTGGYGIIGYQGQRGPIREKAHRLGWMLLRGPIPQGLVIDHMCRVRSCVNPDHLRVVTMKVNSTENSISPNGLNAAKTCCPRCHGPFSFHTKNGQRCGRYCKSCAYKGSRIASSRPEYLAIRRERYAIRMASAETV